MPSKPNSYPPFNKIFHLKPTPGILRIKPNPKNKCLIPHNPPPYLSYPSKHPHIRFYHSISPSLFIRNDGISEKIIEPRENNETSNKAMKLPTIFLFPRYNRSVIFKFTTKIYHKGADMHY